MRNLIVVIVPWLSGVAITLLGQWWEHRRFPNPGDIPPSPPARQVGGLYALIMGNLILMAMLPSLFFSLFGSMLPLVGARAGVGLALMVFVFGVFPARLFDRRTGTITGGRTVHRLLFDFVRALVCFALAAHLAEPWF